MSTPNAWIIAAAIVRDGDRILLLEEDRLGIRRLNTPGGRVRSGERPADTAIRETKEETGLDIRITGLAAVIEGTWADGANFARFVFEAKKTGGVERAEKTAKIHWVLPEHVLASNALPVPIIAIEKEALQEYVRARKTTTAYFYTYDERGEWKKDSCF